MSKRAREKRTQQTEQEQFEAYGEYTYNYLHTMDGGSGEPAVQPSAQAVRRAQKRRRTHGFFKFLGLLTVLTIALVVGLELLNTAVEALVDLVTEEYRHFAAIAKNVAAGAVLFCAFVAVIIGLIIFIPYLSNVFNK